MHWFSGPVSYADLASIHVDRLRKIRLGSSTSGTDAAPLVRSNIRDWLFVEDHTCALKRVLEAGRLGEVYNIGGNCECTNLEVVHSICSLVDSLCPDLKHAPCESLITFVKDRPGHDQRYAMDISKISSELNWQPQETFASGLRNTVVWYLENTTWVERVTSGAYRRERLGLSPET